MLKILLALVVFIVGIAVLIIPNDKIRHIIGGCYAAILFISVNAWLFS